MKHSYTSMSLFLKCPAWYKAQYLEKRIPRQASPALDRGNKLHQMLEDALKRGDEKAPLWVGDGLWEALLAFRDRGSLHVEQKMETPIAVGKIDVCIHENYQSTLLDWKSGQYRPDELQADVYAYLIYENTLADSVSLTFVYLDQKRWSPMYTPGKDAVVRVKNLIDRIETEQKHFPKPDWYCGFCPVKDCRYNKEK